MKSQLKFRMLALVSILSLLFGAFGVPTHAVLAENAGTALQFNGASQYVTFGSSAGTTGGLGVQVFTIELWFKRTGNGATTSTGGGGLAAAIPLVTKGRGEADSSSNVDMNYFFGLDSTGVLVADFEECARSQTGCPATTSNATQGGQNYPAKASTVIQNNIWYHAAVTFDGRYWTFYLNGVQDGNSSDTGAIRYPRWDSIQHAGIGTAMTSTGAVTGFFAGVMDEVRIWNVVRTQPEIQGDMYSELTGGTGLIGRWGLNEGSGTTTANSVAGRPNGTLANSPAWVTGFPIPDSIPPAEPIGLIATAGGTVAVNLSWQANSEADLAGYNLYRAGVSGGPYTKVNDSLITNTNYLDAGLTNGTPYYYVLTAVDSSTNESGYSAEGAATPMPGPIGLDFGSSSAYVTFGHAAPLTLSQFTLEGWFKREGTGTTANTGNGGFLAVPLITKGVGEAEGSNVDMNYFLGIHGTNNVICADFEEGPGGAGPLGQNHPVCGTTVIANNAWYHVAATYDGGTWRLYLNGNPEATLAVNQPVRSDSIQHAGLGVALNSTGAPSGHFDGVLDEVRVWSYARTRPQILAAINSEIDSTQSGLVGRWSLNEGGGTAVNGSAGTATNGTLAGTGYAWVTPGAPFNLVFPPPAAPSGLNAAASSANNINLTWTDSSDNEDAFEIERAADAAGPFSPLTSVNAGSTSYADATVAPLSQYCYRVRAVNFVGASDYSNVSCITTPDEPAFGLDFGSAGAYVTFGDPVQLDLGQFTIETWFKRTGAGTANTTGSGGIPNAIPLVTHGSPESDGSNVDANWILVIDDTTDVLAADFEDMATGLNHPVRGTTVITNDVWHHAAATYDGETWKLYLDGRLETTLAVNAAPRSDSIQRAGLATMLTSTNAPSGHFQGVLDEVRVWNYARTRPQILATINSQVAAPQAGLVGRWSLNEGTGSVVNGSAGTTVNGTIASTGYSWVTPGAPFNVVIDTTPPAAPTNLMASARPAAVQLEWTANTELDLAGYNVYRSTYSPGTKGTPVNGTPVLSPSFLDTGVSAGSLYYYAIAAVDTSGNESGLSNEASAIPLPPPPPEALSLGSANAYVQLGDNADTPQFTLETWLRRDGTGTATSTGSGGVSLIPLLTNGTAEAETAAADINYFFGLRGSDGVLCADFEEAQTGTTPGLNHPVCGTTVVQNGVWYHAAATYDGTTWRLYLNGTPEATLAVNQPANATNTSQLAFGTSMTTGNATSGSFNGVLDEVRIWNYARTQAQIAGTVNAKLPDPQAGLIGRWGMDEGSGSIVNDASGSGITGAITGAGYTWVPGSPFNVEVNLPPEAPVLVEPANNASNVQTPATLSVSVSDPENQPLNVTFYGRPLQGAAGPDFTIVAIPDPQYYASMYPSIYNAQMQWVADNKLNTNILYVASLGDNVDVASNLAQWTNADAAWDILDTANVPYGIEAGNHDGAPSGTANFNTYFGADRFAGKPQYGGHFGSDNDNHYDLFSASGLNFIVIFIEYDDGMTSASHPVLQWANGLLQTHADRRAIVVTHNLLQGGTSTSFSPQGQIIYNALKGNSNLFLMLGGHLDVAARRADTFNGNTVYSLRSDYQSVDSQQSGYLRLMRFSPADDMIYVTTYSPTQGKLYDKSDAAQNNFNLSYAMEGTGFEVIGTVYNVASGSTASLPWPNLDADTQYEWFVIASDGTHQTPGDTWSFTTAGANTAPVAADQSVTTAEETAQLIALTATDAENNPLTFSVVAPPAHGTLIGNAPALTYTPGPNFNGSDSFTFKANDGLLDSNTATVSITVNPVNDAPTCSDVNLETNRNTAGQVNPNCTDIDQDTLSYSIVGQPAHGTASIAGGKLQYAPAAGYSGPDSFTYKASDGAADSNIATVSVTVSFVNQPPVASGQFVATAEDTASGITLLATDVDGDALTYSVIAAPSHGSLSGNAPDLTYTPDTNYNGPDSFTFTANDGTADSNTATVAITVTPVNDLPIAQDDQAVTAEGSALNIAVLANDSDVDADALAVVSVGAPSHGIAGLEADGTVLYTPAALFNGSDQFSYTISDGNGGTDTAQVTVTISPVNDPPISGNDSYRTDEDTPLQAASVLANDTDPENASLTTVLVHGVQHGSLILNTDGTFSYSPDMDFNGIDSFTYQASDGTLTGNLATVTLTVTPVNDAPLAEAQSVSLQEDGSVGITLTGSDVDGDLLTFSVVTPPSLGVLSGSAPALTYAPDPNFNGADELTFQASDGFLSSEAVISLTINPVNDAPVAAADAYSTDKDVALRISSPGVIANDTDVDGDALSSVLVSGVSHGTLALNADGSFEYVPAANFSGEDGFTYQAMDPSGAASTAAVAIHVNQVNYAPTANADSFTTDEDAPLVVSAPGVLGNDTDAESDVLTTLLVSGPANGVLTFNPDGSFTYSPALNWHGEDQFSYMASDGLLESAAAAVTITVSSINDAPIANAQAVTISEDTPRSITLTGSDADSDLLAFSVGSGPANGSLSGTAPNLTYTPNANFSGSDSFTFTAGDGQSQSSPATVSIMVTAVNDPPVCGALSQATNEDTLILFSPDCTDVDSPNLSFQVGTPAQHGTASISGSMLAYAPSSNYYGADSFAYRASDGSAWSNSAAVSMTVNAVNDPPLAANDNATTFQDTAVIVQVLGNDTDVEGDNLSVAAVTAPAHGIATLNAGGSVTYMPSAGWSGVDSFTYTISDGHGGSASASVSVLVSQNDLIFKDGFSSCSASAWSALMNPAALSFSVQGKTGCGMQVNIASNSPAYARDNTPDLEAHYRARFYFNPNGIVMGKSDSHVIFGAYTGQGTNMLLVQLRRNGSSRQIRAGLLLDRNKWSYTGWSTLTSGWNAIELEWRAATAAAANNGGLTLWLNGTQVGSLTGIDNDLQKVDWAGLGAVSGIDSGTRGSYFFDEFESRRSNYIGP